MRRGTHKPTHITPTTLKVDEKQTFPNTKREEEEDGGGVLFNKEPSSWCIFSTMI